MSRDGSSGGVIRTAVITKDGVERQMIPGDKLPRFYGTLVCITLTSESNLI